MNTSVKNCAAALLAVLFAGNVANAQQAIQGTVSGNRVLTVQGTTGQSVNIVEFRNAAGTAISGANSNAQLFGDASGLTNIPGGSITGSALTRTSDVNVTLTLGGAATTALLNAASITAGWAGQLSAARGGTGVDMSTSSGVVKVAAGVFSAATIVNADVSASAAIAVSKLAAGTSGQILLNNATPTPTWTTMTGPVTINSAGVTSIGTGTTNNITKWATTTTLGTSTITDDGAITTIPDVQVIIGAAGVVNGNGVRIANGRVAVNKPIAPPSVTTSLLTPAQILDAGIIVVTAASSLTLPTAASLWAAMPGTPQVGDVIYFAVVNTFTAGVTTLVTNTGVTLLTNNIVISGGRESGGTYEPGRGIVFIRFTSSTTYSVF